MALQELERKLEESLQSLREDNKSLIELLQSRQSELAKSFKCPNVNQHKPHEQESEENEENEEPFSATQSVKISRSQPGNGMAARYRLSSRQTQEISSETDETDDLQTLPKSILKTRTVGDDINCGVSFEYQMPTMTSESQQSTERCEEQFTSIPKPGDIEANAERYLQHLQTQRHIRDDLQSCERMRTERLMADSGNDRQRSAVARTLAQRPKNSLFDLNAPDEDSLAETLKRYKPAPSKSKLRQFNYKSDVAAGRDGPPLLGYDWIAGVLENQGLWPATHGTSPRSQDATDSLFQDISEFRKQNRQECVSTGPTLEHYLDLTRPISPLIEDPGHTCIHGFNVNERLFTEAVNLNEEGKSMCPVCLAERKEPTAQEPAFVRVSIPKSAMEKSYKIKPHTRKSFQPCDSMALSHHCLAGYKSVKPATLPTARSLDLKDKIRAKETTTYAEAREVAESFSRMGRLLSGKPVDRGTQQRLTNRLLQTNSTGFRYEMDTIQRLTGIDAHPYRATPTGKA